jgi:hypothetical protein
VFQKRKAKYSPQSETIVSGRPCRQKILDRNTSARPFASIIVEQWAKYLSLVRWLTTTQIISKPSELGNPATKSRAISHQGYTGIGKAWRTPYYKWYKALVH